MGPLQGVKILEIAGIGPGPFCAMLLADMGADIIRVEKADSKGHFDLPYDFMNRNRRSVDVDLKTDEGKERLLKLVEKADVLIEGYRPGVMERLGVGPEECMARNEKLIYGRMTGWGQDGPYAKAAGHDINYIALTGALDSCSGKDKKPAIPLNMVGDFGGGSMYLAVGVLSAYIEAQGSGKGQIVDAAICDCATHMMSMIYSFQHNGWWTGERGGNLIDGGSPFYDTYETKDDKYVAIGPIEPQFFAVLIEKTGIDFDLKKQMDRTLWPDLKEKLSNVFKSKTRDEWGEIFDATDGCVAPVLGIDEASEHPHMKARGVFGEIDGVQQPMPAPRFSRTKTSLRLGPTQKGANTQEVLSEWGIEQ